MLHLQTAPSYLHPLSLHDALPISPSPPPPPRRAHRARDSSPRPRVRSRSESARLLWRGSLPSGSRSPRSEEHTSELQSPCNLICRLLLEKINNIHKIILVLQDSSN